MPTYEYECADCKHNWEIDQGISEEKIKTCPKCNKDTAKRLIAGGTAFVLQGGGWGNTGYS